MSEVDQSSQKLENLTSLEAWELLQNDPAAVLVDIRSNMEYLCIGHPLGSVHIPWIDEPDWKINPNFVREIRKLMLGGVGGALTAESSPRIILLCRSGKRSLEAGELLVDSEITNVSHVTDGFEGELDKNKHRSSINGWRHNNLPWEQC
jgi:rhodanese-related sulfurtransferase